MAQILFIPDPRPLVERLGRRFFLNAPERPGVYLMRDDQEQILYVGKAKNLRKCLSSYRVANPDRMARRHLRLLRQVVRIELQECADEMAASEGGRTVAGVKTQVQPGRRLGGSTPLFTAESLMAKLHPPKRRELAR